MGAQFARRKSKYKHQPFLSFMAESEDRIDAHGAARGNVASQQSHANEKKRYADERQRISGTHSEQQPRHQARHDERRGQADRGSSTSKLQTLAQNIAENIAALCTKSQANANFPRVLAHDIRNHSIYSQSGEEQGGNSEEPDNLHREAPLRKRVGDHRIERLATENRQLRIHSLHLLAY